MSLKKRLENYEFYTGVRDRNTISVSELSGSEPFQMALERAYVYDREKRVTQMTLGSIFDAGMRCLAKDLGLVSCGRKTIKFDVDGVSYTISGEPDLYSKEDNIIYDVKLTQIYSLKKWQENPKEHQYTTQLNWYRYMSDTKPNIKLLWFLKDQKDTNTKDGIFDALSETEVPIIDDKTLIENAKEKIIAMNSYLENGCRGECQDKWGNDMKCRLYCSQKAVCPYANKRGYNKVVSQW